MSMEENFKSAILDKDGAVCEIKDVIDIEVNEDGAATNTVTLMTGITVNGTFVWKRIDIDDNTNRTVEEFKVVSNNQIYTFRKAGLTRYCCAEMTALAIEYGYGKVERLGIIGNGKTNVDNAIMIAKKFGTKQAVIRGSDSCPEKNVGDFMTIFDEVVVDASEDMRELNKCDVVVICTSSCDKKNQISANQLYGPELIVCLDCGFYLDESFREERASFTDYDEQIMAHWDEEFPFDKERHQLINMHRGMKYDGKAVIYLYGISIADAFAGEKILRAEEKYGLQDRFIK